MTHFFTMLVIFAFIPQDCTGDGWCCVNYKQTQKKKDIIEQSTSRKATLDPRDCRGKGKQGEKREACGKGSSQCLGFYVYQSTTGPLPHPFRETMVRYMRPKIHMIVMLTCASNYISLVACHSQHPTSTHTLSQTLMHTHMIAALSISRSVELIA